MNKIIVYLSTIFPAKTVHPTITCRPARIPTLGSPITATRTERSPDDYSPLFDECRRIFAGR